MEEMMFSEEMLKEFKKSKEVMAKVMMLADELNTPYGFGAMICTVMDQWCSNHDVDYEEFRKRLNEIMEVVHGSLDPLPKMEV